MRTLLLLILILVAGALIYLSMQRDDAEVAEAEPATVETPTGAPTAEDEGPETLPLPRFDIVRVDRSGYAVVAGAATPGSQVELLANGEVLATTTAEADGNWVIDTQTPLAGGPVELALRMTAPDGLVVTSSDTVIIYVPEREGDRPIVLRTTPGGATEILQRADDPVGDLGPLAIESIDYDEAGNVIFAGRADPNSVVEIFTNGTLIGQAPADEEGRWDLAVTMAPGRYILQIIQLGPDGRPVRAIEVPFEQASFDDIRLQDGNVIVQPGNSLWVIARRVYGTGYQYTVIYEANAEQIRDPDLIYPGQIFRLPEDQEAPDDTE
jgi:nucleoid-associated protein YgaU